LNDIFSLINNFFAFVTPITDAIWDFPTNIAWYASIPILGQLSLPVIILVGTGIYFTLRTGFIQRMSFGHAIRIMMRKHDSKVGVSAFGSFILGLAMRVGPGNIVGITGAISVGGPGALFWMWVAAFFGMTSAFMEAVLSQLFKEKKNDEFVGGLPFYGRRILGNRRYVGLFLSSVFIIYALFNVPAQTFNVFSSLGSIAEMVIGSEVGHQSPVYYTIAFALVISCAFIIFGGIRRVVAYAELLVPAMAALFCGISLLIVIMNYDLIPFFFKEVFGGAFSPHALFGGAIGTALAQGVKRGLMSNEAGQGTITMAAAVADNKHPCEQGFVQSFGVFIDTMVICTLTGFVVVMAHIWSGHADAASWEVARVSKIGVYLTSVQELVPAAISTAVKMIMCVCYALFAFTTLLGMISFAEISANFISKKASFITFIRILGALVFVPFGALTVLAGFELGNLWYITDLTNIVMVYLNIPLLLLGAPFVYKALQHYRQTKGEGRFVSADFGFETECWKAEHNEVKKSKTAETVTSNAPSLASQEYAN